MGWGSVSGLPPPLLSAPGSLAFPGHFLKFLFQRDCQGGGIIKSSPPCHKCSRSSGAGGQKLLAISSGRDLCFDRGRGGLQSIKPWPGLGRGLSGEGGAFTRGRGYKDTALPLRFGEEAGGMPRCWLSWKLKLPDVGFGEGDFTVRATRET